MIPKENVETETDSDPIQDPSFDVASDPFEYNAPENWPASWYLLFEPDGALAREYGPKLLDFLLEEHKTRPGYIISRPQFNVTLTQSLVSAVISAMEKGNFKMRSTSIICEWYFARVLGRYS